MTASHRTERREVSGIGGTISEMWPVLSERSFRSGSLTNPVEMSRSEESQGKTRRTAKRACGLRDILRDEGMKCSPARLLSPHFGLLHSLTPSIRLPANEPLGDS